MPRTSSLPQNPLSPCCSATVCPFFDLWMVAVTRCLRWLLKTPKSLYNQNSPEREKSANPQLRKKSCLTGFIPFRASCDDPVFYLSLRGGTKNRCTGHWFEAFGIGLPGARMCRTYFPNLRKPFEASDQGFLTSSGALP